MHRVLCTFAALLLLTPLALAQGDIPPPGDGERLFGFEFEFAGEGNRIVQFENMPWANYENLMRVIVEHYGGDPSSIRRVDFETITNNRERFPSGKRQLFRAEWTDARGRTWQIVPEFVATGGYDGYELVTPPLDDPTELGEVLRKVQDSGLVREGLKSGTHLTIDGRRLVTPEGNARALANVIMLHENMEPMLRRLFNPVRGGGHVNRFARSLSVDHPELLEELDRLRPEERTVENMERIFERYEAREREVQGVDPAKAATAKRPWKYRSMNLSKMLWINKIAVPEGELNNTVEFRMFDLSDAETHRLQAEVYRRLVRHAEHLAAEGIDVRYEPRAEQPLGEDPSVYNTSQDVDRARQQAREMLETLGLEPSRFEELIETNVKPRSLPTASEVAREVDALPRGRVLHNGAAFTYGFELEGSGHGFARISVPKDPRVRARWGSMSDGQRFAYFRSVVGNDRRAVKTHFELDVERYPWLDPNWKVEGSGNWEVRSLPFDSIGEATDRMREIKRLTGRSAKGFHLHMRDNGVDFEALRAKGPQFADFLERAGNWVWMERARRMGSMTSLKSWSNARPSEIIVSNWAQVNPSSRSTLRTGQFGQSLDIEIRGLTLWVDDIERLAKIFTARLRTLEFGPWEHTDNPLASGGNGTRAPAEISVAEHLERYMRRIEGVEISPELKAAVDFLQNEVANKAAGSGRFYATNIGTPLLPWDREGPLSEALRREMRFAQEDYLISVRNTAQRLLAGEYGEFRIESGQGTGSADWNEIEKQMRFKVKEWAKTTGLSEGLYESLFPRPTAVREEHGFARARAGGSRQSGAPRISAETAQEVFAELRDTAARQIGEGHYPDAAIRMARERMRGAQLEVLDTTLIDAHANGQSVRITTGLLNEIDNRANQLSPDERPAFRRRALGLILAHELAHVSGNTSERVADAIGVRTLLGSNLGRVNGVQVELSNREIVETLRVFDSPAGASRIATFSHRLRGLGRYGGFWTRVLNIQRRVRESMREAEVRREQAARNTVRGLPLPEALLSFEAPARDFDRSGGHLEPGAPRVQTEYTTPRGRLGISEMLSEPFSRTARRNAERARGARRR